MSSDNNTKQVGDYLLNDEIGSGGFPKVVLGTHIPTGEKVAIKIMDKEQILSDELNRERVLSEIAILKIVRHNNIIKLYEVMETPKNIYLVMEYCDGGELFDYIVSKQHLSEKQACVFFQEIIDALTYLHSQNIVHRDVKPENILLESFGKKMTCKLIDFGISRTYTLDKLISTPCGTASYAPPEMHRGEEYYGLLSDVWSAGVLLYAMVFGYLPFCEEDEDTNIDNIIKGNYEIPEEASPDLTDFLKHILDIDPLTRYDLEQIKQHPWYNIVSPVRSLPGLIIGYHKIPIDERILNVCEAYGFDKNAVKQSVMENKYDNKSSIYYIILNKMKREGYDSMADLYSEDYLEYIKNPNNLIEKEKKEENKEEKKEELPLLNDKIKPEEEINKENKKENEDKNLINPELDQISVDKKLKPNKSEAEISLASESSKKEKNIENNKENENNTSKISSPKRSENGSKISSPVRSNKSDSSSPKRKDSDNLSAGLKSKSSSPSKEVIIKKESTDNLQKIDNNENEMNENKEEEKEKPLETLSQKILEEKNIENEENLEIKNINIEENIEKPVINNENKVEIEPKKEEIVIINKNEEEKVEEKIENPTVEQIIKEEPIKEKVEPIKEKVEPMEEKEKPEVVSINQEETKKEKEEIPSIQIEKEEEPLIVLSEKINTEKEKKIEIKPEQIEKKENNLKKEIPISNRPKNPLSYSLIPKHSFLINSNTKKMLSFTIEEDDKNKLNSSFTKKLSDDLKENVLKLRNPKTKNPNKEKEIKKALHEIKQNKNVKSNQKKDGRVPKPKNKKNIKLINDNTLFKDSKGKGHTIIRNRNASVSNKRSKEIEDNIKNKRNKGPSTSMAKIERKNLNNANNVDLKNTIKKVNKEKNKEKDKNNESSAKKRNISIVKKNVRDDTGKKSHLNLKKNIPKPDSTIKKNQSTSGIVLNTTSNTKPARKNVSTQKKNILKTPSKNLDKTHFEPIYKKIDNKNNALNKNEMPTGNLNKTIQLSDTKRSNKKSQIPYDKKSNKKYKKNIRIAFKNIEEEDINDNNKTSEIDYNKSKSNKVNITFNLNSPRNNIINKDNTNNKKRKVIHNKNNSMRENSNNRYIYTQNNDNLLSHRDLNNYQKSNSKPIEENPHKNKNRYQSVIKTERINEKTKKFLNGSAYEGTKTEILSGKSGNIKFMNNNKVGKKLKNNYYGPIDIKNILIGNSLIEITEKLMDILHKHRVKYWKLNPLKFYCNKNGEIFVIEIYILPNKLVVDGNKNKEENEISEFDINKNENNNEINKDNNDNKKNNNKAKKMYYITILSKDSSNKAQAKNINKIINKKFNEIYKK